MLRDDLRARSGITAVECQIAGSLLAERRLW